MKKFDLIVFDLDGTLFDTKQSIMNSVKRMIDSEKLRKLSEEEVQSFLGPPLIGSIKRLYPELTDDKIDELVKVFRKHYSEKEIFNTALYDGMLGVLEKLKKDGYKIALATYKQIKCVNAIFEHFDITKYFDSMHGTNDKIGITKADIIKEAMDDCNVHDVNRICMVGDTEHDFNAAIKLELYFIGMTYGMGYNGITEKELKYEKFLGFCDEAGKILSKIEG